MYVRRNIKTKDIFKLLYKFRLIDQREMKRQLS